MFRIASLSVEGRNSGRVKTILTHAAWKFFFSRRFAPSVGLVAAWALAAVAWGAPLSVDLSTREQSRQFYRAVYWPSEGVPMGFTGDVAGLRAGDTSAAFKEAVRLRVNFVRAFAGIPGEVTFVPTFSAKCQQTALMGSLNNSISHAPATTSKGYTAEAAEAAGKSNLAIVESGPSAIMGYLRDEGVNNPDVGHRRWLLFPQTREMGTGDVPSTIGYNAANALWILDEKNYFSARPTTRTAYIAWPPAGYVPNTMVYPRWSLSVAGANFSQAFVAVRRNGTPVTVAIGGLHTGYGENSIVWSIDGQDPAAITTHDRPASDVTYAVEVTNVLVGGTAQSYRYSVIVFDPDTAGSGGVPVKLAGSEAPVIGQPNAYTASAPSYFNRLQWRSVRFAPAAPLFDAEGGLPLNGLVADTNGYSPVVSDIRGAGAAAFRLVHPAPVKFEHTLTLPDTYYAADQTATLTFLSRLGFATSRQIARVQISVDDGVCWTDVYRQLGDGTAGEQSFSARSISLAALERRTFRVRFNYTFVNGGSIFSQTDPTVGWYFDNIALSGIRKVTATAAADIAGGSSFNHTPSDATEVGLQSRGLIDVYPAEWSTVLTTYTGATAGAGGADPFSPVPVPTASSARLVNLSVLTNAGRDAAALVVGFNLTGTTAKPVLIRGIGPTLTAYGVGNVLADPKLVLKTSSGVTVLENDNWGGAASIVSAANQAGAFALDASSRDAVILPTLNPGSYTATVTPANSATAAGTALVEVYDTDTAGGSRLNNVSALAQIAVGDVLTVGFAISGTGNRNVLVRAIGPTLADYGVAGTLANPKLEIFRNGVLIRSSDNWNASLAPAFASVGAFALTANSADAALALTLGPGTYTAQASGVSGTSGAALIEVYELP